MQKTPFVHVVSKRKTVLQACRQHACNRGWNFSFSHSLSSFLADSTILENQLLILEQTSLQKKDEERFLERLALPSKIAGLLLISDLRGFEEFLLNFSDKRTSINAPLIFLEKPFEITDLEDSLDRLGAKSFHEGFGFSWKRSPFKTQSASHQKVNIGDIIRTARENLGLTRQTLILAAAESGLPITEDRLKCIEENGYDANVGCNEWFHLTTLLEESADCIKFGYDPLLHLYRIRTAIQEKTYLFKITLKLKRKLDELERRERIEKLYLSAIKPQIPHRRHSL